MLADSAACPFPVALPHVENSLPSVSQCFALLNPGLICCGPTGRSMV